MSKKIVFTGGGSAGHVTPNLGLIEKFTAEGWQAFYIGSKKGLEKTLIAKTGIPYFTINAAGLKRSLTWKNLIMPFKVLTGICMAWSHLYKIKPNAIFSKGGFIALPVVIAAWLQRIPVIAHESDYTPGLANKLCFPFIKKLCLTFEDTKKFFSPKQQNKLIYTGTPIRKELFQGNAEKGRTICSFNNEKPILLVQGGGLGAASVNQMIRELLPTLLETWQVAHLCGARKTDPKVNFPGYKQFEYLHEEYAHVLAAADLVISRSGANSVYEILALHKLALFLPLTKASRGDQIYNAKYCVERNLSRMLLNKNLTKENLLKEIYYINSNQKSFLDHLDNLQLPNAVDAIYKLITQM